MEATPRQVDVVIVGAGPTGLSAAASLVQSGVGVAVIERDAAPIEQSRAVWVHPRTVELWDGIGVAGPALRHGRQLERIDIHPYTRQVGTIHYDGADRTPFPRGLILEQSVTQRLLLERLDALGVAPRWSHAVTGLQQDADGVTVTVEPVGPDGTASDPFTIRARYVIGADGASSTVRGLLGLTLEGGTYASSFFSADVVMDTPLEPTRAHMSLTLAQTHALLPLPGERRWRVVGNFTRAQERRYGQDAGPTGGADLHVDDVRQLMASMRIPHTVTDIEWATVYRSHHRLVDRYRMGRVFLAGDAAHIHSPAGGLGMNTGIGDALNLAWKVAAAVHGHGRDALLDSYEAERRPVAESVLKTSDRIFTLQADTGRAVSTLRVGLLPLIPTLLSTTDRGRRFAFEVLSQIGITYRDSATTADVGDDRRGSDIVAGDRLPFAALQAGGHSHDLIDATGHTLALVDATRADHDRLADVLDPFELPVTVRELDDEPALREALDARGPTAVLVRPDGHISWIGPAAEASSLRRMLTDRYAARTTAANGPAR